MVTTECGMQSGSLDLGIILLIIIDLDPVSRGRGYGLIVRIPGEG